MSLRPLLNLGTVVLFGLTVWAQSTSSPSTTTPSSRHSASAPGQKPAADSGIDAGSVMNGVYHNKSLGLTYKIPAGWVLRTEEMNAEESSQDANAENPQPQRALRN